MNNLNLDVTYKFYKVKLMEFYDIYWRTPSRREFADFIFEEDIEIGLFRDALTELHFQKVSRPSSTIEVIGSDNKVLFIGTSKDLEDELEISQPRILQLVASGMRTSEGYKFRLKPYKWNNKSNKEGN